VLALVYVDICIYLGDDRVMGGMSTHSGETGDGGIAMFPCARGGVERPEM
jgi:hypothetical protein